jgi:hypothetical protein
MCIFTVRRGYAYPPRGGQDTIDVDLDDYGQGVPLKGITEVLNRLALDGWAVVSTSEDKGLYEGADAARESYPARIRYLLVNRPSDASAS